MRKRQSDAASSGEGADPQFVTALDRGLRLLRAFHPNDPPLGNQELAARTGLPRPTVSRLTYTLMQQGFLDYVEASGKYRLGLPLLALGYNAMSGLSMRQAARPLMQPLADHLGLTVALTSRDRLNMVYVEFCRGGGDADPFWLDVGFQIGIADSASGRAYLAALAPAARAALLDQLAGRHGAAWPALQVDIAQAVENYHRQGFCRSAGEWRSQASFLAVPLQTRSGFSGFVVNCGGPTYLLERHQLDEDLGPRLGALAESLSAALFGR